MQLRTTLLFSGPCIHQRFLRSLQRGQSRQGLHPPPLLTVVPSVAVAGINGPPPLPLSSRVRSSGNARLRCPFRRLPAAPATPVASKKGPGKSPPDGVPPLSAHWRHWQAIGAEFWVLSVLRDGYRIPFKASTPPLACTSLSFLMYRAGSPRALALRQEVEKMLSKDALEIVLDPGPGFYSRLFLVEKVTGGCHPVIDLSHLSEFVLQTPFKMETVASVLLSIREGDFLASIVLKDVYFQVPVHQSSRKLLMILLGGSLSVQGLCASGCRLPLRSSLGCLQRSLRRRTPTGFRLLRYQGD